MKQLIWKLVLPLTIISFALVTKWWYVSVVDGWDEVLTGFPLPYKCPGWHTSMSLQIFVLPLIIDFLTYFFIWFVLIFCLYKFVRQIKMSRIVTAILLSVSGILAAGMIFLASNSDNIISWERDFEFEIMDSGFKMFWQQKRPEYKDYNVESEDTEDRIEYFSIKTDTTYSTNSIENPLGIMTIATKHYCLNDSAVENEIYYENDENKLVPAKSVAHNYELEIEIKNDSTVFKRIKITKETFADCLNSKSLDRRYLYNSWTDTITNTECIMRIGVGVPDTDDACHIKFSVSLEEQTMGNLQCLEIIPLEYGE